MHAPASFSPHGVAAVLGPASCTSLRLAPGSAELHFQFNASLWPALRQTVHGCEASLALQTLILHLTANITVFVEFLLPCTSVCCAAAAALAVYFDPAWFFNI